MVVVSGSSLIVKIDPDARSKGDRFAIADAGVPEDRNAYEDRQLPAEGFPPLGRSPKISN